MKVALVNTYSTIGGAAIATYRLHSGLRSIGVDSHLLVMLKDVDDSSVITPAVPGILNRFIRDIYAWRDQQVTNNCQSKGNRYFSPARCPDNLTSELEVLNPDLVHLTWVNNGFMKIETLGKFNVPVVWTLHDMWAFTGGCHYDEGCGRFRDACGKCPILDSTNDFDLSYKILERKINSWGELPLIIVTPSQWLADMARTSAIFKDKRVEVIPNGIDTKKYKPIEKDKARKILGLPQGKRLVLFSALNAMSDKRKGNQFLISALNNIARNKYIENLELIVMGSSAPADPIDLGMKSHYMGRMEDEAAMALLYSAADVTVAPSMQENLSNSVMESLSCGTPVVAFRIGGMPDMIDHQSNGYLANPFETDDLAAGLVWVLENHDRLEKLSQHARHTVMERYDLQTIANRYLCLYQEVINNAP